MDELLKNCNDRFFKVGDKVRIRRDIGCIALLKNADPGIYSKLQEYIQNYKNVNYAIQHMTDFLGGDK